MIVLEVRVQDAQLAPRGDKVAGGARG